MESVIPKYDPFNPPKDFTNWILSINKSWLDRISYQPFEDYVKQCHDWINEAVDVSSLEEGTERYMDLLKQERERFKLNSLYYLNKYNYYKEAKADGGKIKVTTCDSQNVMAFLVDAGFNLAIAKARGIRASSTFLPIVGLKAKCYKNIHIKYICSDDKKVKNLFDDKLKFSSQNDPDWMQMSILSDRIDGYHYGIKDRQGKVRGLNSKITINAPSKDAINGQNPDIVLIDEAPSIAIFDIMLKEGRPGLFTSDPITNVRSMTKQIISFGSSQSDEEGDRQVSDAFESYWKGLYDSFQKGDFYEGTIPVFFDCFSIPGMTRESYEKEMKVYSQSGKESDIIRGRKHYPTCPDDVFLRNIDTIIPYEDIQGQLDKIYMYIKSRELSLVRGYFQPIYNKEIVMPEGFPSPFAIRDVQFVPCADGYDSQATVTIFEHPKKDWIHRYYQGTDPIVGVGGHSKFSSSIFDGAEKSDSGKTISAILNCRPTNYKLAYEQAYCLHLYYSNPQKGCFIPELLEINVGNEYHSYCEAMKFGYNMLSNLDLPDYLQVGDQIIGINKKSNNKDKILNKTEELFSCYGDRIFHDSVFQQLKTYVRHKNKMGNDSFSPATKADYDDEIDSCTYAYICYLSSNYTAKNIKTEGEVKNKVRKLVFRNGYNQYV